MILLKLSVVRNYSLFFCFEVRPSPEASGCAQGDKMRDVIVKDLTTKFAKKAQRAQRVCGNG